MPALYSVQIRTHTGVVREVNEDVVGTVLDWRDTLGLEDEDLRERGHLFVVADGMGGHAAGEVASSLALKTIFQTYYGADEWQSPQEGLENAIAAANTALCEQASANPVYAGMGTTVVALVLHEDESLIANVGDSRAYLFRSGEISRITSDHSWVAVQVAAGVLSEEQAARHPYRNVITRSLGPDRDPTPDFYHISTRPGDLFLLCSDGLSNLIGDDELARFLGAYPPDQAADILLEQTLERGAPDNVSFALIEILAEKQHRRRLLWPWLLLALAVIALIGYFARDQLSLRWTGPAGFLFSPLASGMADPATAGGDSDASPISPTATPIHLSLAQPTVSGEPLQTGVPLAEPLQVASIKLGDDPSGQAPPDRAARFGDVAANGDGMIGRPLSEHYVYYLQGPVVESRAESDTRVISIRHLDSAEGFHDYKLVLRQEWAPGTDPPAEGDYVGVIGRPISEEQVQGDIALEPLAVLNRQRRLLWGELPLDDGLWVFSVYGPGGSDGLDVPAPAGKSGDPIVLWGAWQQDDADAPPSYRFHLLDAQPYELEDGIYRQPGDQGSQ